ncbi:hypothetical protein FGG08_002935 [Glutinoglossum americanum]|uniref:Nuclear localization protein NPL6 n=1 Tax=Glutinoglossum americanum TaxID=1670608 RepID=A0A9P8IE99_9PEZI|nr:hypothetical protein FGG08_002935 [Glutinoglossum americanum]
MPDVDVPHDSSGEEEGGSPEPTADPLSEPETPIPQSTVPRKRRLGRPPKNKPLDWDNPEEPAATDNASEIGTPVVRRRRGRPPASGSRFKPRGGPSHITQVPIDKEGNMMDVVDDEVALPEDPEGETKVDKMGRLQDGREYRCRTFTILGRGERLYMLSTEPARCIGFRDSYLFFQKHKQLYKIIVDDHEKRDLIDRELIPHSYKGRAIGVVTARSVFREFGARIVVGGRKIVDDYQVAVARANGEIEGDLADPNDKLPKPGESYNKNQYVAWHGASSVYHSGAPSVPMPNGKVVDAKKKKVTVTETNWMLEHAMEASRFNTRLLTTRRKTLKGVYDPHTNSMQYPSIMQPTHAHWEQLPTPSSTPDLSPNSRTDGINTNETLANGTATLSTDDADTQDPPSIFPAAAPVYMRNFMIADTFFASPPLSGLGVPGPDGDEWDVGPRGVSDVPDDVIAMLPPECLGPFLEVREEERKWKESWSSEAIDGARAKLRVGF